MNKSFYKLTVYALLCLTTTDAAMRAQVAANPPYALEQTVIAGGGGTSGGTSGGNTYSIEGSIGQPIAGGALDGSAYTVTSGFWNFTPAAPAAPTYEGDVGARPGGDGVIQSNDVTQVQRFEIGLDRPFQSNEFQRADSAPFATRGDGAITSADTTQTQRYEIGLDARQLTDGPTAPVSGNAIASAEKSGEKTNRAAISAATRRLRVESVTSSAGQQVTVNIRVDAGGDEAGYGFTLIYDAAKLTVPSAAIGAAGGSRNCNSTVAGEIRCSVRDFQNNKAASSTEQIGEIAAGGNRVLTSVTFTVAAGAAGGATPLTLANVNASNDAAQNLTIDSQSGAATLSGAAAAAVSVGGRVVTSGGRGIRNVTVTMTDASGASRTAISTAFGYFQFNDVAAGETYTFRARGKRFVFQQDTQVRSVAEAIGDINFVADELQR